jgi:hypothetical protein
MVGFVGISEWKEGEPRNFYKPQDKGKTEECGHMSLHPRIERISI